MKFPKPLRRWISEQKDIWEFDWFPINLDHIFRTNELPDYHNDPFDRLIVSQCLHANIPVVTPDSYLTQYPIEVIW
jgi:PIN domain nuclease of toxin-antitoxin system